MTTGADRTQRSKRAGVHLRAATPADAPLVMALTLAAYEEYRGALVPESGVFDETVGLVRTQLDGRPAAGGAGPDGAGAAAAPVSGGVIASVDGAAVGCARWSVRVDDARALAPGPGHRPGDGRAFLHVGRVAVVPEYRERGIATALMAWCEDIARQRGLPEVRLGVRLSLARNESFYRRLGYRPTGALESREGYGPIAAWMSKRIGRPA